MANKVNIVITATDKASGKIGKLGGGLKDLGKKAALGIGLVGVAAAGAAVAAISMAADFETGMNEVATLAPDVAKNIDSLKKGVLDLSTQLGTNAVESTKALYQAISAGVPAGSAIDFLKTASKAAIGGVTDTETAVDGLTTVMNAFKGQNIDAEKAADIMFATVKAGKTDFAQLSSSLFNVAPLAAAANVKFEDVSAALATLTAQGTPTSVATTQIRAAIQAIIKPSKEMKSVLAVMTDEMVKSGKLTGEQAEQYASLKEQLTGAQERGQNLASALKKMTEAGEEGSAAYKTLEGHIKDNDEAIEDNIGIMEEFVAGMGKTILESEGLEGVFKAVGEAAGGNQNEMTKMLGSVEGLQAVLGLTGANADAFATNLDNMSNSAGAADGAFEVMEKGFSQQMKKLKAGFQSIVIQIGEKLIPAIQPIVEWMGKKLPEAFAKVSQWIEDNQANISEFFTTVKDVAQVLWEAIRSGLEVILPLFKGFVDWLKENKPVMIAVLVAIGAAIVLAMGPVSLAALAIVGIVALIGWMRDNWSEISAKITEIVEGLRDAISDAWTAVKTKVTEIIEGLHTWITDAWNTIKTKVTETVQGLRDSISAAFQAVKDWFTDNWPILLSLFMDPFLNGLAKIGEVKDKILIIIQTMVDKIKGFFDMLKKIPGKIRDAVKNVPVVGGIANAAAGLFGRAQGGPVMAGTPYMVGERGPEAFIPNVGGRIIPNGGGMGGGMGGGLTVNVYQTINGNVLAQRQMEDAVVESVIEARRRGRI